MPVVLLLALMLLGCTGPSARLQPPSSPLTEQGEQSDAKAESAFQASSGTLTLVFDAQGHWIRLSARGQAGLADDSPATRESALMIATLRAKRALAEFLSSQVRSESTVRRIARRHARNLQSAEQHGDDLIADEEAQPSGEGGPRNAKQEEAHRVASALVEHIQESSAAILKGVHVTHRVFEHGQVVVEVSASRQSIAASRQVSKAMAEGL